MLGRTAVIVFENSSMGIGKSLQPNLSDIISKHELLRIVGEAIEYNKLEVSYYTPGGEIERALLTRIATLKYIRKEVRKLPSI